MCYLFNGSISIAYRYKIYLFRRCLTQCRIFLLLTTVRGIQHLDIVICDRILNCQQADRKNPEKTILTAERYIENVPMFIALQPRRVVTRPIYSTTGRSVIFFSRVVISSTGAVCRATINFTRLPACLRRVTSKGLSFFYFSLQSVALIKSIHYFILNKLAPISSFRLKRDNAISARALKRGVRWRPGVSSPEFGVRSPRDRCRAPGEILNST